MLYSLKIEQFCPMSVGVCRDSTVFPPHRELLQVAEAGRSRLQVARAEVNARHSTCAPLTAASRRGPRMLGTGVPPATVHGIFLVDGHYEIDPSELHRVYPKVFTGEPGEPVARPEVVTGGFTLLPP